MSSGIRMNHLLLLLKTLDLLVGLAELIRYSKIKVK